MIDWKKIHIGKAIKFNPSETLPKGKVARKIPMANLTEFQRQLNGFEFSEYKSGPKFRNADTLLSKITPCLENGKTAQVDILNEDEVAFGSSEFIVLRATKYTDPDFVYYLSISPTFRKRAISCMEGTSGRKRVNENTLKFFELPFPGIDEQKRIAAILKKIDNKIEVNTKINQELEAMAKTLYDYWFVQFDFPAYLSGSLSGAEGYKSSGGEMVFNEELKREIPEGWDLKDLCEIELNIITGKTPPTKIKENFDGDIPFITIDDIRQNLFIYSADRTLTELGAQTQKNKYLYENDICVSCIGTVGVIGFVGRLSQSNQQINTISKPKNYNRYFLFHYLKDYFNFNTAAKKGAVLSNMNKGEFETIRVLDAPITLKEEYFNSVHSSFKRISNNIKQNQKLAELRDWLLPMLMNGQVTVEEKKDDIGIESGVKLDLAAEPPTPYGNENSLSDLFPTQDLYAEVACMLAIEKEMHRKSRGKTWVQKTANHLKEIKKEPALKNVVFEEYHWGMFSPTIAKAIDTNPFLTLDDVSGVSVYKVRFNKIAELNQWMKEPRNADFVASTRDIVSLYDDPLINNDLDRIELLNTVFRCIHKLGTTDFEPIYQEMREWRMKEQGFANKAEKFEPYETKLMIQFIKNKIL